MNPEEQNPKNQTEMTPLSTYDKRFKEKFGKEWQVVKKLGERLDDRAPVFNKKVQEDGSITYKLSIDENKEDDLLIKHGKVGEAVGLYRLKAQNLILNKLVNALNQGSFQSDLNGVMELLYEIKPQDPFESMLVHQMIATHIFSMEYMKKAAVNDESVEIADRIMNRATKLQRTFLAQLDALNKHRGKGQQKMTVEHVNVNAGGKAIVGNVEGKGE